MLGIVVGVGHTEQFLWILVLFVLGAGHYFLPHHLHGRGQEDLPDHMGDFVEQGKFPSVVPGGGHGDGFAVLVDEADVVVVALEGVARLEFEAVAFNELAVPFGKLAEHVHDVLFFFAGFQEFLEVFHLCI